jgi:hypothetical protein
VNLPSSSPLERIARYDRISQVHHLRYTPLDAAIHLGYTYNSNGFPFPEQRGMGLQMNAVALETIAQQIEQLAPDDKWTLLSVLIDSLRHQAEPARRRLCDYLGAAKGRGFRTAQEVDTTIREERDSWET